MFLKAIEIRGFKSFADKIQLDFQKGVTAVVGPNGSGKSNISDAIRWVLGEQSIKTLRGGKMEDVIFSGTQYRKSVGLAQVVLTLDNSDNGIPIDYEEVTISRRLYRSGDSEYYINSTKCRLKDIQELFMDTGIGKEGYSIIGQGKIEAVLSGKSEERRGLLEEAAGIVKFKTRKEEAEKKLESTEENLIRINDILSTYEERLDPLEKESEKAQKFVSLSNELTKKEINMMINSLDKLKLNIEHVLIKIKNLDSEVSKLNDSHYKVKDQIKIYNKNLYDIENLYKSQREEYYEKKSQYQSIISDSTLIGEKIENLNVLKLKYTKELEELEEKINIYQIQNGKYEEEYLILKNKLNEYNKEIVCIENKISDKSGNTDQSEKLLKKYKNEEFDILGNISDLKNSIILTNKDIDSCDVNINQMKKACESYVNSIKINKNTKNSLESELIKINDKIQVYEERINESKKKIISANKRLTDYKKQLNSLNAYLNKSEATKNMLSSLENQYEGYNKSVKNLMMHMKNGHINKENKKCFVLGEVIKVEEKLETAIEIALGAGISNIIVEDEFLAKDLINYLKNNNLGRATFLPLDILQNKNLFISNDIRSVKGYMGIASELIDYNKELYKAVEHVLGRIIIADNMESALIISKKTNFKIKIVTLSGEIINPGGSLTGGSIYNKNFNIIGRKREINDLDDKITEIRKDISEISIKIDEYNGSIKSLDDMNLNLRDSIHFENIEITKIQGKITNIDMDSKRLDKNYNISMNEIKMLKKKKEETYRELLAKENEIKNLEINKNKIIDLQEKLEVELLILKDQVTVLKDELTSIKINKVKLDESSINKQNEINRLREETLNSKNKVQELKSNIEDLEKDYLNLTDKLETNNSELKSIEEFLSGMDRNFEKSEFQKIEISEKLKNYVDEEEQLAMLINKKEEEHHRVQLSLTRLEAENDGLIERLNDEFKLTYAQAVTYRTEIDDIESYKSEIKEIKSNISALGNVNVGAIEEYKAVKEKYNFMWNQKEDLVKSKDEIINVIAEMTDKMKSVFSENFEKIRKNFSETFCELFKGGNADLILSGEDVLSSNIEINVEPPGKKLQNINLMSGGEKGLSAIALLFAILKMKPTPFCILDEIEAALDDANVARYADFLRKFSERIQFIVITHRKGTMEASDVLYGVTMEEKGVSKVVSVDLAV